MFLGCYEPWMLRFWMLRILDATVLDALIVSRTVYVVLVSPYCRRRFYAALGI